MSNKETNIAEAAKKPDTLILLEKMFAEKSAALNPVDKSLFAFTYRHVDENKCFRLLIEVYEDSFFIKIIDLNWHKVSMDDIEEVTRIQSAINKFNHESRAKVNYLCQDDGYMTLSTIMFCPVFEEIPDLHGYLVAQLDSLVDAREYVLFPEKLDNLPFWEVTLSSQSKSNKEIVLEALEELHCVPEVQVDEENFCSIISKYQEEYFVINTCPTNLFVKLFGLSEYVCDFNIDMLSAVKELTNDMKWDSRVPFNYEINNSYFDDKQFINVSSFIYLPCVEGKSFAKLLRETFRHCFYVNNYFKRTWALYYEK